MRAVLTRSRLYLDGGQRLLQLAEVELFRYNRRSHRDYVSARALNIQFVDPKFAPKYSIPRTSMRLCALRVAAKGAQS